MVYVVRAVLIRRGSTLRAELETRQPAIRSAKELRGEGFEVTITDRQCGDQKSSAMRQIERQHRHRIAVALNFREEPAVRLYRVKINAEGQLCFCAVCWRPIRLNCAFCSSLSEL